MASRDEQWQRLDHHLDQAEALVAVLHASEPHPAPPVSHKGLPDFAYLIFDTEKGHPFVSDITVLDTDSPFSATATFLDSAGNPTQPNDVPQWSSDNEGAATVAAADDGLSATVTVVAAGVANVGVSTTDADGTVVTGSGAVTVNPSGPPPAGPVASVSVDFTAPGA